MKKSIGTFNGQDVKLEKQLGQGNFAIVYATSIPNMVAKVTFKNNTKGYQAYLKESGILKELVCECVVGYRGTREAVLNN
jgi:hypothetical protein